MNITDYYWVDYYNALFAYPHYLNPDVRIEKGAVVRKGYLKARLF